MPNKKEIKEACLKMMRETICQWREKLGQICEKKQNKDKTDIDK